jgi:hypothetical protein
MKHLTLDELVELGSAGQTSAGKPGSQAGAGRHLDSCADCASSLAKLRAEVAEAVRLEFAVPEPPERDESYGQRVWQAIAPSLPVYESRQPAKWRSWAGLRLWKGLSYAAACALLLAGAFLAGSMWQKRQQQPAVAANQQPAQPQIKQPIVVVVLNDHLDRSERFLVELKHADIETATMGSPLSDQARSLLAANRICRKKAEESNDPALSTALDHLDGLLAEMANQPGGLNSATLAKLQEQMNAEGLLFEVRVLRSRTPKRDASRAAAGNRPSQGGTI